jgi:hypothetical protein
MHGVMLRPILFRPILLFIIAGASFYCRAGETYQPLFVVERSSNANVVHYDAKIDEDGRLDSREPVIAYWIMAAKDGRRQELNFLEKSKAYGVIVERSQTGASYRIVLVSQKNREIEVYRDGETVRAKTTIGGRRAYLKRIYVAVRKGSLFSTPSYVELMGTDIATGETLQETIVPGRSF